jgi:uncharacterized protein (TIGR02118 family)
MIKVSVMYPHTPGARFDHAYYRETHMPLVQTLLGEACAYYDIDKGIAGGEPGSPPVYVGACHIFSPSIETFGAAMAEKGSAILADIGNYTDIAPIIQTSEVIVGHPAGSSH